MFSDNLQKINKRIYEACKNSGRDLSEVTLIAVSKTKPVSAIEEAYEAGIRDFGENKVLELIDKAKALPSDIRWHFIGHLQTNKVKLLVGNVFLIHSIDSVRLAKKIDSEAEKKGIIVEGLLEINVALEESKFGFLPDEIFEAVVEISKLKNLKIVGLMTVAPDVDVDKKNRRIFKKLSKISVDIMAKNLDNIEIKFLSMGMTGDFEVALEEGANFIRVGTGLFGIR